MISGEIKVNSSKLNLMTIQSQISENTEYKNFVYRRVVRYENYHEFFFFFFLVEEYNIGTESTIRPIIYSSRKIRILIFCRLTKIHNALEFQLNYQILA